jgi:hypothetical protein
MFGGFREEKTEVALTVLSSENVYCRLGQQFSRMGLKCGRKLQKGTPKPGATEYQLGLELQTG